MVKLDIMGQKNSTVNAKGFCVQQITVIKKIYYLDQLDSKSLKLSKFHFEEKIHVVLDHGNKKPREERCNLFYNLIQIVNIG